MPEHLHHPTAEKLHLLSSPLVRRGEGTGAASTYNLFHSDGEKTSYPRQGLEDDVPELQKHEEPTLLEIFFDLFFAANFNAFINTQKVTEHARFKAFIGYFFLLWATWFLVTLFDVRYVADSIFSRATRAIQLGVLVGFVVVAPKFNPTDQEAETMRAMSIILAVSRACLALEYGSTLWHLRSFKKTRVPLYLQIGIHLVASAIYLGITFRFKYDRRSRVYIAWYFIGAAESIGTIVLSNFSPILSLTKTHLMKRLTLLTVMIMGDGIIQLAKEVVLLVEKDNTWDSTTIGLVTAAAATIYFLFLIYFDMMKGRFYLPALRQQLCSGLFTQWIIWARIWSLVDGLFQVSDVTDGGADLANTTSLAIRDDLNKQIQGFLGQFPPNIPSTQDTINDALNNITSVPDSFWPQLLTISRKGLDASNLDEQTRKAAETFFNAIYVITSAMANALFAAFKIGSEDQVSTKPRPTTNQKGGALQFEVNEKTWDLCKLVFAYGYIAAGCTIISIAVLSILARTVTFKTWHMVRYGIVFVVALGTALTATLWYNEDRSEVFLRGPWVLPTITIVWTTILIITHINGPGARRLVEKITAR
ncbi:hypothetical protein HIM_10317 [Hirsutella minnesotensis 3608]|uniref:Low temperature requirement A n=1 Tax=Hirsutella minnesotensis 3608 TaxID=1043627 RepID=A0A0F7ZK86_9HYPO|nr:hypothetical protein HIM_10317 [Hirsutella minnesotensis 3608]